MTTTTTTQANFAAVVYTMVNTEVSDDATRVSLLDTLDGWGEDRLLSLATAARQHGDYKGIGSITHPQLASILLSYLLEELAA